jgi:chemotaxis signal transduction protein
MLIGPDAPARKFFLVVNRQVCGKSSPMAIPVTGECELADAEELPTTGELPPYVSGLLSLQDEIVEVLDVEKLLSMEAR